jgi:ABC-type polysaccharide/polyol phosphate export permease
MLAYLGAVWKCRYFWLSLVRMDLRARYRGSALGLGWSLLHPLAMTVILCTAFGTIFNADLTFYGPFLITGLTTWIFLLNVAQLGSLTFFQGEPYIRQFPAPMAIYPLRTVLANAFHFLVAMALAVLLTLFMRGLKAPGALLSLLPTFGLLFLLGWSMATVFGLLSVRFRDITHVTDLGFQSLFYLTPVIYEPRLLRERQLDWLLHVNPVVPLLELVRQPILYGEVPSLQAYASAGLIVLVATLFAAGLLRREERRLIFLL